MIKYLKRFWRKLTWPKPIYTVYVIALTKDGTERAKSKNVHGNDYFLGDRVWGWYRTIKDCEFAIENNVGDLFEYYYNYACIEEVQAGIWAETKVIQWYKATYTKQNTEQGPDIVKCDPPPYAKNACNFTMG